VLLGRIIAVDARMTRCSSRRFPRHDPELPFERQLAIAEERNEQNRADQQQGGELRPDDGEPGATVSSA
jgi:hypothetical protein